MRNNNTDRRPDTRGTGRTSSSAGRSAAGSRPSRGTSQGRPARNTRYSAGEGSVDSPTADGSVKRSYDRAPKKFADRGDSPNRPSRAPKNFDKAPRTFSDSGERSERAPRKFSDRGERGERSDRPARSFDRGERSERPARSFDRGDRPARAPRRFEDKGDGAERPARAPRTFSDRGDRPARSFDRGERSERPARSFDRGDRPARSFDRGDRPARAPRRFEDKGDGAERPARAPRTFSDRGDRPARSFDRGERSERPARSFDRGDRPARSFDGGDRPARAPRRFEDKGDGAERPARAPRTFSDRGDRPARSFDRGDRPARSFDRGDRPAKSFDRDNKPAENNEDTRPQAHAYTPKPRQPKSAGEEGVRLNKFIANSGICSRREADDYIIAGLVSVNGVVITELGTRVFQNDIVKFNEERIKGEDKVYIVMNKPKDFVTTMSDPHADKTVMSLIEGKCAERVYPVGRLDKATTGVLLLTNDGDLADKLTHPSFEKKKIYHVFLDKNFKTTDFQALLDGVQLEDGFIQADALSYIDEDETQVGVEIHSGRNRIVRRVFEHFDYKIKKLDRVYFAGLTKKNLRRGQWRFLTDQEVAMLKMGSFE